MQVINHIRKEEESKESGLSLLLATVGLAFFLGMLVMYLIVR